MGVSSSENLAGLEKELGYKFKKKSLLKEALTHKSCAHEHQNKKIPFNERLEFLGDSVLELIISEHLFSSFSEYTEADLSKIKAYAVQEAALSQAAESINIGMYLRLGKGEEMTGGREKRSLLADAYEALLAAIYLDGGYKKARDFALRHLTSRIDEVADSNIVFDFKTRLQEVAQAEFGTLPEYIIHREEGPEHQKTFGVKVYVNDTYLGSGKGRTKKAAAQKAAEAGLKKLKEKDEINL